MNDFRVAARGNATTFPLPWESLLNHLQAATSNPETGKPLPHTGAELREFVSVILKTQDEEPDKEALSKFIHQAVVRRHVVVDLILCSTLPLWQGTMSQRCSASKFQRGKKFWTSLNLGTSEWLSLLSSNIA